MIQYKNTQITHSKNSLKSMYTNSCEDIDFLEKVKDTSVKSEAKVRVVKENNKNRSLKWSANKIEINNLKGKLNKAFRDLRNYKTEMDFQRLEIESLNSILQKPSSL